MSVEKQVELEKQRVEANKLVRDVRCYEVVLSTKDRIKLDSDELIKVTEAITTGSAVLLKQGFFNPSFFVGIVDDFERKLDYRNDVHKVLKENKLVDYNINLTFKPFPKFKELKNIFEDVPLTYEEESLKKLKK